MSCCASTAEDMFNFYEGALALNYTGVNLLQMVKCLVLSCVPNSSCLFPWQVGQIFLPTLCRALIHKPVEVILICHLYRSFSLPGRKEVHVLKLFACTLDCTLVIYKVLSGPASDESTFLH